MNEEEVQLSFILIIASIRSLTYFNINLVRVRLRRIKARPEYIHPHDILSIGRKAGHSGGVLKGKSTLYQISVRVRY